MSNRFMSYHVISIHIYFSPVAVFIDFFARRRRRHKQAVIRLTLLPVYRSDVIRSLRLSVVAVRKGVITSLSLYVTGWSIKNVQNHMRLNGIPDIFYGPPDITSEQIEQESLVALVSFPVQCFLTSNELSEQEISDW